MQEMPQLPQFRELSLRTYLIIALIMVVIFAAALYAMGQVPICKCGYVKFWHGAVISSENSQHLADWYTPSHVIHGFVFFWILWWWGRRRGWPIGLMFLGALFFEMAWELFENTDFIINRYRETTIALDYYGDSVINSVADVLWMSLGFYLAYHLPTRVVIALLVIMELVVGYYIRDNLALNIIMLIYPFDFILNWQKGG